MNQNNLIDFGASIAKLSIENSNLLRNDKELAKYEVDALANIIKTYQYYSNNNISVLGFNILTIKQIKMVASQCLIEKIVLFPVIYTTGNYEILIKVYGQDRQKIFDLINVKTLNTSINNEINIDSYEKNYGVIIYERE